MTTTMTHEQAINFDHYSQANAMLVKSALTCGCKPYEDVFTYNRWKAQGFFVKRGEHALKLPVIKHAVKSTQNDTGEITTVDYKIFGKSAVFCRHQVEVNE